MIFASTPAKGYAWWLALTLVPGLHDPLLNMTLVLIGSYWPRDLLQVGASWATWPYLDPEVSALEMIQCTAGAMATR